MLRLLLRSVATLSPQKPPVNSISPELHAAVTVE